MADFNVNQISNKNGDQGPTIAGVTTVSSTGAMRIPSGNTGMRVEYNTVTVSYTHLTLPTKWIV